MTTMNSGAGKAWLVSLLLGPIAACTTPASPDPGGAAGAGVARLPASPLVANVLMARAPVPVDGAIVFRADDGVMPTIDVRDPMSALVPGRFQDLGPYDLSFGFSGRYFAWLPNEPFTTGTYSVAFRLNDGSVRQVVPITIVEPFGAALPELDVQPSTSTVGALGETTCCQTARGAPTQHCDYIERHAAVLVDLGFSTAGPAGPLNQLLFRWVPTEASGASDAPERFAPLSELPPIRFFELRDEYCVDLEAQSVVTLEVERYRGFHACVPRGELEAGTFAVTPNDAFFALDACPQPPPEFKDHWCALNMPVCAWNGTDDCARFRRFCELPHR